MDLQIVCQDVMDDVDGSLGCVLTDLETGLPLASEYRAGTIIDANMIALISYVGIDLFRGKLVHNFERTLSRTRASSEGFVREVQVTTSNTYQFMSAVPGWDQAIFILVTDKNVSLGMGLLAVHDAVRRLAQMPLQSAAPVVNPTFQPRQPREEVPEPSTPPLNRSLETRQPEPQYNGAIDAPPPPQPTRAREFETPRPQQHERPADTVADAPAAPEPAAAQSPSLDVAATEDATPLAESRTSPAGETPEATKPTGEQSHDSPQNYRGVVAGSAETGGETPRNVPIGPRARMFFKRTDEDKKRTRRRRS